MTGEPLVGPTPKSENLSIHPFRRLWLSSGLLGVASVAAALKPLFIMPALAVGDGIRAVGFSGLATILGSAAGFATSFGMNSFLTREIVSGEISSDEGAAILALRAIAAAAICPLLWLAATQVPDHFRLGFLLLALSTLLDQIGDTAWSLRRALGNSKREAFVNILLGSAVAILVVIAAVGSGSLTTTVAGLILVTSSALGVVCAWPSARRLDIKGFADLLVAAHAIKSRWNRLWPYLAADILGLAYLRGGVVVVAAVLGTTRAGTFQAGLSLYNPLVQAGAMMGVGTLATYAGSQADQLAMFERIQRAFLAIGGIASAMFLLLGPFVIALLYEGTDTSSIALVVVIISPYPASRLANFAMSFRLLREGRSTSRLAVVACSAVFGLLSTGVLSHVAGLRGAALAVVVTEAGTAFLLCTRFSKASLAQVGWMFTATLTALTAVLTFVTPQLSGTRRAALATTVALASSIGLARTWRRSRPPLRVGGTQ